MMHYELKIGKSVIWNKCSSDLPERQKSMYIKKMSSLELPFEHFPFEKKSQHIDFSLLRETVQIIVFPHLAHSVISQYWNL